jgi:hypothetical protein
MTIIRADNFYPWRSGGSFGTLYSWSITGMGWGACPSGYGACVQRPVSTTGAGSFGFQAAAGALTNKIGMSAIFTIDIDPASTTWWKVMSWRRSATNEWGQIEYQPSTNLWRVTRDLSLLVGATFAGPANVKQPFEVAVESQRDPATGYFRVWFNGVLAYEILNVNTGTFNGAPLAVNLNFPGTNNTGGLVTASNWIIWNPDLRSYPGRRIVQTLEPIGDLQKQWTNPPSVPAFGRLVLSPTGQSPVVQGTIAGQSNIYDMQNFADEPLALEALFIHYNQVSGTLKTRLIEAGGEQSFDTTFGAYIRQIPTDHAGQPWTKSKLDALVIGHDVVTPNISINHMHLLAIRSIEGTPIVQPSFGRAFIISS